MKQRSWTRTQSRAIFEVIIPLLFMRSNDSRSLPCCSVEADIDYCGQLLLLQLRDTKETRAMWNHRFKARYNVTRYPWALPQFDSAHLPSSLSSGWGCSAIMTKLSQFQVELANGCLTISLRVKNTDTTSFAMTVLSPSF